MPRPRKLVERYPIGALPAARIDIVRYLPDVNPNLCARKRLRYLTNYWCCGRPMEMTHESIASRILRKAGDCLACINHRKANAMAYKTQSYDYKSWVTPDWPVPPLVREMR